MAPSTRSRPGKRSCSGVPTTTCSGNWYCCPEHRHQPSHTRSAVGLISPQPATCRPDGPCVPGRQRQHGATAPPRAHEGPAPPTACPYQPSTHRLSRRDVMLSPPATPAQSATRSRGQLNHKECQIAPGNRWIPTRTTRSIAMIRLTPLAVHQRSLRVYRLRTSRTIRTIFDPI